MSNVTSYIPVAIWRRENRKMGDGSRARHFEYYNGTSAAGNQKSVSAPTRNPYPSRIPLPVKEALSAQKISGQFSDDGCQSCASSENIRTVSDFFPSCKSGSSGNNSSSGSSKSPQLDQMYFDALLQNELRKEDIYFKMFPSMQKEINLKQRNAVISWIFTAAVRFNYSKDAVYIAVFLVDAFVHKKPVKSDGWQLLGMAAFHIAGKLEEKRRAKLPEIWTVYKGLRKFTIDEVLWMEREMLCTLRYNINPPTPKIFVDLALKSRLLVFPCYKSERLTESLAQKILLQSLSCFELSKVKSSLKAEVALVIARDYIRSNTKLLTLDGKTWMWKDTVRACYLEFRKALRSPGSGSSSGSSSPDINQRSGNCDINLNRGC